MMAGEVRVHKRDVDDDEVEELQGDRVILRPG
jgi:hypothetical protein